MRHRKVVFTERSRDQLRAATTWWIENDRPVETLLAEIEQAVNLLGVLPGAGTLYPRARIAGLRRLYLRRLSSHRYYTFTRDTLTVRALWHARRGHGPFSRS